MNALELTNTLGAPAAGQPSQTESDVVISVQNVGKMYRLYDRAQDRLKEQLFWRFGKHYGREFWALHDVSFEVRRGERLGIIGRNGAGKSTLLQILAGVLPPSHGEFSVSGRVAALLELGSGFNFEFTGRENVFLNGSILGISQEEIAQRFDEIAAFADIGDFIDQPVKLYSSGMVIRLAFAISASIAPDVLILDEALAVGDIFFTQKCFKRLDELIARGTAIVLVTHDVAAVGQFCSTVMVLDRGLSIYYGGPVDGVRQYLALQRYAGQQATELRRQFTMTTSEEAAPVRITTDFDWPAPEVFLNLDQVSQEGLGWARCTGVAICDEQGTPRNLFEISERAVFYYEFLILEDIGIPIGGVTIVNEKNVFVHGKNSLQYNLRDVSPVSKGTIVRFRQSITLDVTVGNYTFVVGLATLSPADYQHAEQMSWGTLSEKTVRVLSVGQAGSFSVTFRTNGQALPHHGLCNLPGECAVTVLQDTRGRHD